MAEYCSFLKNYNEELYEEAVSVHNLIFVDSNASLLMGRRYIEQLVNHLIKDQNINDYQMSLKDKIEVLRRVGVYKDGVYDNLNQIRLLGNKAAHESGNHSMITALKIHRSIHVLSKWYVNKFLNEEIKLPDYEDPKPPSSGLQIDEVMALIQDRFGSAGLSPKKELDDADTEAESEEKNDYQLEELMQKESYLTKEISRMKSSSKEALENLEKNDFNNFKKYLHVERNVQTKLEEFLKKAQSEEQALIFLAGSVGDGKSHLLSYLKEHKPELIEQFHIVNDATESQDPQKTSLQSLAEAMEEFSDTGQGKYKKVLVAINLGIIHNFVNYSFEHISFEKVKKWVEASRIFSANAEFSFQTENFYLVNFSAIQPFELSPKGVEMPYFQSLIRKITEQSSKNPFYIAYRKDIEKGLNTIVHLNFELLNDEKIQKKLLHLLTLAILKDKLVISTRAFLSFISDLLLPANEEIMAKPLLEIQEYELLRYSLVNQLFTRKSRSDLLRSIQSLDPVQVRHEKFDTIIQDMYHSVFAEKSLEEYFHSNAAQKLFKPIQKQFSESTPEETHGDHALTFIMEAFIRTCYLTGEVPLLYDTLLQKYAEYLYAFNKQNNRDLMPLYQLVKETILEWKGSPKNDYVYINSMDETFRVAQKLIYNPIRGNKKALTDQVLSIFESVITINVSEDVDRPEQAVSLQIDFNLFELLTKVKNGYRPNAHDHEDALSFVNFIDELLKCGKKNGSLLIHHRDNRDFYKLEIDKFTSAYVFEKVEH